MVILFVLAPGAYAFSCAARLFTLSEAYAAADSIIVGLVTECKESVSSDPYASGGADCSFTSLEVIKDSAPARDYSGVVSSSGCGLSVNVGDQYLLFLDSENRPLWFSASLSGDLYPSQQAHQYLQILRDFRDRRVGDLAEPWELADSDGGCSIWQSVKGNRITFTRRKPDAPQQPRPEWTQDAANGETVYRATVPLIDKENGLHAGTAEVAAFGANPDVDGDALLLRVTLLEQSPTVPRQASVSVGNRSWSLNRMETILRVGDGMTHKVAEFWEAGATAERILSAMLRPSDIAVTATIVTPNAASEADNEPPPGQAGLAVATADGDFFGQAPPRASATRPSARLNPPSETPYRGKEEPAEPVLRVESRSTQLASVIQRFRACYAEGQR